MYGEFYHEFFKISFLVMIIKVPLLYTCILAFLRNKLTNEKYTCLDYLS